MRNGLPDSFRAVVIAAEALGIPRAPMLAALGMRWEDLASYELRVPYPRAVALWDEILRRSGDPMIAARIGPEIVRRSEGALFAYTVRSAPNIAEAWTRLAPLVGLLFGGGQQVVHEQRDGRWEIGYRIPLHVDPPIVPSEECLVISFVAQCRAVAPAFRPDAICFQHPPSAPPAQWRRALGCAVEFDQPFYGLRLDERAYRAPIEGHDPSLAHLLDTLSRPLVTTSPPPDSPTAAAIRVIRERIDRREPVSVATVARALHVSTRTLQRQLAAAGTSVRIEYDRARSEIAVRLLRESHDTVAEIADRLGYADPSQLTRAVKRWTGEVPTQVRGASASRRRS